MNILFLSATGAARAVFAQTLLNSHGSGLHRSWCAAIEPAPGPHPHAVEVLRRAGHAPDQAAPEHLETFLDSAPEFDVVFTLGDDSRPGEIPLHLKRAVRIHWPIIDPRAHGDSPAAFQQTFEQIDRRIRSFCDLQTDRLSRTELRTTLEIFSRLARARETGRGS